MITAFVPPDSFRIVDLLPQNPTSTAFDFNKHAMPTLHQLHHSGAPDNRQHSLSMKPWSRRDAGGCHIRSIHSIHSIHSTWQSVTSVCSVGSTNDWPVGN
jgi:hypothetical protein